MKILLLDEDEMSFEVLSEVASLSDSEVVLFKTVEEAKNYISNNKDFHAVIALPKLGNIPSLQILAMMKKDPDLKNIPFMIISHSPTQEEIKYYKAIGVVEVFEIPFNPLEVFLIITNYLKDVKGEEEVRAILQETKKEKSVFQKILEFINKLFGRGK
ncbi:MAG: histidine kinase [Hydrogenothermaceae bacterium]|nr:histidine kinase [Hydrogenothermaceae bacterium]